LLQDTRYPWDGEVSIQVGGNGPFSLFLRIPSWCEDEVTLEINGQAFVGPLAPGSYVQVHRTWQPGDVVQLRFPLQVRLVESHPYVPENTNRVALMRGPLLYCLEGADHPDLDLRDILLPADVRFAPEFDSDLLGGVMTLNGRALLVPLHESWYDRLYRTLSDLPEPSSQSVQVVAIPYYAWANRGAGPMQVWLRSLPVSYG
jgi:DUF1680 family protein